MKKIVLISLAILLALLFPAGIAEKTDESEAAGPAPVELLAAQYNPFYDVTFPANYTIYKISYVKDEYNLYYLCLIAEDTAENVVTFISNLLGDGEPDSIAQNLAYLGSDGVVRIDGSLIEPGLNANCEIYPTRQDGDYAYVDGYVVELMKRIETGDAYDAFLAANLNLNALSGVHASMDLIPVESATVKVYLPDGPVQLDYLYEVPDAAAVKENLIGAFADAYVQTGDRLSFTYGDLNAKILFSDVENGNILIEQMLNRADLCLGEYVPSVTLETLGFSDYRESGAKCTFQDDESGVFLSVSKSEWGENENGAECNAVMFMKKMGDGLLTVFYYPETKVYQIQIDSNGAGAQYAYHVVGAVYVDAFGGDDLENARQAAEAMFQKPDEDDILQDAWVTFDLYVEKAFGISVDALFYLEYAQ